MGKVRRGGDFLLSKRQDEILHDTALYGQLDYEHGPPWLELRKVGLLEYSSLDRSVSLTETGLIEAKKRWPSMDIAESPNPFFNHASTTPRQQEVALQLQELRAEWEQLREQERETADRLNKIVKEYVERHLNLPEGCVAVQRSILGAAIGFRIVVNIRTQCGGFERVEFHRDTLVQSMRELAIFVSQLNATLRNLHLLREYPKEELSKEASNE